MERLAQDTDDNVGVGPERCVFASPLVSPDGANQDTDGSNLSLTTVNSLETPSQGIVLNPLVGGLQGASMRQSLSGSVHVGEASPVTFVVELFVLSERSSPERGVWKWGVTMCYFKIYLSTDHEGEREDDREQRESRHKEEMYIVLPP